eukprot:TRINITY_DN12143_c4_g6_i1.p1 TRINITY_DN12143_c4_g6~~TRINITY_DN12143_c4_g6_i1.p1  ORF type:complete len:1307 (+),score=146.15 TRINITY_DN12143_c4_g6_i1:162-4082(+)
MLLVRIWLYFIAYCYADIVPFDRPTSRNPKGNATVWDESFGTRVPRSKDFNMFRDIVIRAQITLLAATSVTDGWEGVFESGGEVAGFAIAYRNQHGFSLTTCGLSKVRTVTHTIPQGWLLDGRRRYITLTVQSIFNARLWRLYFDALEISQLQPPVKEWVGTDVGSTGLEHVHTKYCGWKQHPVENASSIWINGSYGIKGWGNVVWTLGHEPPSTKYIHTRRLDTALGLSYLRFQPAVTPYNSLDDTSFVKVLTNGNSDLVQYRVSRSSVTIHLIARFASKITGLHEILFKAGGADTGISLLFSKGNVLTAHLCRPGSLEQRLVYHVPAPKLSPVLDRATWMDITISVNVNESSNAFQMFVIVDNDVISGIPEAMSPDADIWTDSSPWWFGSTEMSAPSNVCGVTNSSFGPNHHIAVAVPYGIRMWQGHACDGINCLQPFDQSCKKNEIMLDDECVCAKGSVSVNGTCSMLDPCSDTNLNNCHKDAICRSNGSTFSCYCRGGFRGNGFQCEPTQGPISSCLSCNDTEFQLPDKDEGSYDAVCADSDGFPMSSCREGFLVGRASGFCHSLGLRACTIAELQANEARGTGCNFDHQEVASSTLCDDKGPGINTFHWAQNQTFCRRFSRTNVASVRCCADNVPKSQAVCLSRSCGGCHANMGTQLRLKNGVCGGSDPVLDGRGSSTCSNKSVTLSEAQDFCARAGARLCTLEELASGIAAATGCGHDGNYIWSSTPCGANGTRHWLGPGNAADRQFVERSGRPLKGPICGNPSDVVFLHLETAARCCSDQIPDARCNVTADSCASNPCQNGGQCVQGLGRHFACDCQAGFTGDTCEVSEWCSNNFTNQCDGRSTTCTVKPQGVVCMCKHGYMPHTDSNRSCIDIDECAAEETGCGANMQCQNTDGSFLCQCLEGFTLVKSNESFCVDIDECALELDNCDASAKCSNTVGGFECKCSMGFKLDDNGTSCVDIDECSSELKSCGSNAKCQNAVGSFQCSCNKGFQAADDAASCLDIDECALGTTNCGVNSQCVNTRGSFECRCRDGFEEVVGSECVKAIVQSTTQGSSTENASLVSSSVNGHGANVPIGALVGGTCGLVFIVAVAMIAARRRSNNKATRVGLAAPRTGLAGTDNAALCAGYDLPNLQTPAEYAAPFEMNEEESNNGPSKPALQGIYHMPLFRSEMALPSRNSNQFNPATLNSGESALEQQDLDMVYAIPDNDSGAEMNIYEEPVATRGQGPDDMYCVPDARGDREESVVYQNHAFLLTQAESTGDNADAIMPGSNTMNSSVVHQDANPNQLGWEGSAESAI